MPFASLGLPPAIVQGVRAAGYTEPTPIQAQAIPARSDRPRPDRRRPDRHRQDRRLPAAHPRPPARGPRAPARARPHADPRAGRPGRDQRPRLRALHRSPGRRRVRRRADRPAGAHAAQPGRRPAGRHARAGCSTCTAARAWRSTRSRCWCSTRPTAWSTWASRPTCSRILRLLPDERQTLMFSRDHAARAQQGRARRRCATRGRVDLAPPSRPAAGITQAVYPVPQAPQDGAARRAARAARTRAA